MNIEFERRFEELGGLTPAGDIIPSGEKVKNHFMEKKKISQSADFVDFIMKCSIQDEGSSEENSNDVIVDFWISDDL